LADTLSELALDIRAWQSTRLPFLFAMSCPVCASTGLLLQDACPLCDGEDTWPSADSDDGVFSRSTPPWSDSSSCGAVPCDLGAGKASPSSDMFTSTSPPNRTQAERLARGLFLAGAALEAPRFHRLCRQWRIGQCFQESDDPDRTKERWRSPPFALGDASAQRAKTSVEELPVPSGFARVVRNALDPEHCAALISLCNEKGFTPALINQGRGRQRLAPDYRDGFRVIVDDDAITAYLFEVLRPYIPEHLEGADAAGLNRRCRFLCYTPGQEFPEHEDGRYTDPSAAYSRVTVQLYLHNVPPENGGATTFIFRESGRWKRLPCQPQAGSVLLFDQCLTHEGSLVERGVKYTMRSEVMYTRGERGRIPAVTQTKR